MKYIIANLLNKKLFTIISIVLISFTILLLFMCADIVVNSNQKREQIVSLYSDSKISTIRDIGDQNNLFQSIFEKEGAEKDLLKLYTALKENEKFTFVSLQSDGEVFENYTGSPQFVRRWISSSDAVIKAYRISSGFLRMFSVEMAEGRFFEKPDFTFASENRGNIPVVLGYDYQNHYAVGDEIASKYDNFTVVGFLSKGTMFPVRSSVESILETDSYMIIPFEDLTENSNSGDFDTQIFQSIIICEKGSENFSEFSDSIEKLSASLGLYSLKIYEPFSYADAYLESINADSAMLMSLFVILFVFSFISISSALLASINSNIRNYGVYLLTGASVSSIARDVFLEIAIIVAMSILVGTSVLFVITDIAVNVLLLIGAGLMLTLVLSVVPVTKIMRLSISEILKKV
ncbi:hypothetical protein FACS1894105_12400 [Clostridia bacterium]|nr:hypothetical protein FACS1894105_12400 [Clostridia bacterium]